MHYFTLELVDTVLLYLYQNLRHCTTILTLDKFRHCILYLHWKLQILNYSIYTRTLWHCTTEFTLKILEVCIKFGISFSAAIQELLQIIHSKTSLLSVICYFGRILGKRTVLFIQAKNSTTSTKHIHSLPCTQNPPVDPAQRQSTPVHFITLVSLISILILSSHPRLSSRHSSYLLKIRNLFICYCRQTWAYSGLHSMEHSRADFNVINGHFFSYSDLSYTISAGITQARATHNTTLTIINNRFVAAISAPRLSTVTSLQLVTKMAAGCL